MRILLFSFFIIVSLICSCSFKEPQKIIEDYADEAIQSINEQIDREKINLKTIILPFQGYYEYDIEEFVKYQGDLNYDERYFESLIFEKLVLLKNFQVFTRNKLERALEELKLQHSDMFDLKIANDVGKFVGADIIIIFEGYIGAQRLKTSYKGSYIEKCDFGQWGFDNFFIVEIHIIEIETGEVIAYWHERKNFKTGEESIQ